ncbi:MAG: hypothetical protein JWN73_4358 [Betaproteobacteria bacterium]|nr:hypothetical protein [Betaproteobacteria bacterium]
MEAAPSPDTATRRTERGMLALGLLSAFLLGPLTGVPGLIWARRLRPFSDKVRIGHALCWYGCFVSWTAVSLVGRGYRPASLIETVIVLACNLVWLAVCRRFVPSPARTRLRALLVAVIGTLIITPIIFPSSIPVTLPLAVVTLMRDIWPLVLLLAAIPVLFIFPAHLALYWPSRALAPPVRDDAIPSPQFCRVVSYLAASVFCAWLISLNQAPGYYVYRYTHWLDLFWLLAMPVISILYAIAGIFHPVPGTSAGGLVLSMLFLLVSFSAAYLIAMWITSRRMPG